MTLKRLLIGGAAMGLFAVVLPVHDGQRWNMVAPAAADVDVSIDIGTFYDDLAPYGGWTDYGGANVFIPSDIDEDWRPYTRGHWEYTSRHGWIWISDESHGWATYHYGRWGYGDDIGWYWVPGTRWAPAWVSWRRTDDHVVWAPLPPSREYDDLVEFEYAYDEPYDDGWVVVPSRSFLEVNLFNVVVHDYDDRRRIWRGARRAGDVTIVNNIVVNNVIDVDYVERRTRKQVRARELADADNPRQAGKRRGDKLAIYNPRVKRDRNARPDKVVDIADVKERQIKRRQRLEAKGVAPADDQTNRKKQRAAKQDPSFEQPADKTKAQRRKARQQATTEETQQPTKAERRKRRAQQADEAAQPPTKAERRKRRAQQAETGDEPAVQTNRQKRRAAAVEEGETRTERRQRLRRQQQQTIGEEAPATNRAQRRRRQVEQQQTGEAQPGLRAQQRAQRAQRARRQQAEPGEAPAANNRAARRKRQQCDPTVNPNC